MLYTSPFYHQGWPAGDFCELNRLDSVALQTISTPSPVLTEELDPRQRRRWRAQTRSSPRLWLVSAQRPPRRPSTARIGMLMAVTIQVTIQVTILSWFQLTGCKKEEQRSAWPNKTQISAPPPSDTEEERVDLYGDRLPSTAIVRLGSVRMTDRALGSAIFSVDGAEIITSSEDAYLIWQTTTAKRTGTLALTDAAPAMALSPSGNILATATFGGDVQLWNFPERKTANRLTGHRRVVSAICFVDDQTMVTASADRSLKFWNITNGSAKTLRGDWEKLTAIHCLPDGTVVFADLAGHVLTTQIKPETEPSQPRRLRFAGKRMSAGAAINNLAVEVRKDGKSIAAAINDGSVALWTSPKSPPLRFDAHKRRTLSVSFSAGQLMTSGADPLFRLWDAQTGEATGQRMAAEDVEAQLFQRSPDGNFIVAFSELREGRASEAGRFWLYDGNTGTQLLEPERHTDELTAVVFGPGDKTIITASADGTVALWNADDGTRIKIIAKHKGKVRALAFSNPLTSHDRDKNNALLSVGDDARLHSFRFGGKDSIILQPLGGEIYALASSPSSNLVITGDFAGKVWSHRIGGATRIAAHDSGAFSTIHDIAFAPDGNSFVIAGGNRNMHLISAATGKTLLIISPPEDVVSNHAVAFSPDGKLLASGGDDHKVRLWSTASWKQAAILSGHDGTIRALAFSSDSSRLASGSSDEVALVWDVKTRTQFTLLAGHRGAVTSVKFSKDGHRLVTASSDKTALIWELDAGVEANAEEKEKANKTMNEKAKKTVNEKAQAPSTDSSAGW